MAACILHSEEKSNLLQLYDTKMYLKEKITVPVIQKGASVTSMALMIFNDHIYGLPTGANSIICLTCTDN